MGADRWSTCPRCLAAVEHEITRLEIALAEQYGVVSRDEYRDLETDLLHYQNKRDNEMPNTLREDYSFANPGHGSIEVEYTGSCHICGFSRHFETTFALIESADPE